MKNESRNWVKCAERKPKKFGRANTNLSVGVFGSGPAQDSAVLAGLLVGSLVACGTGGGARTRFLLAFALAHVFRLLARRTTVCTGDHGRLDCCKRHSGVTECRQTKAIERRESLNTFSKSQKVCQCWWTATEVYFWLVLSTEKSVAIVYLNNPTPHAPKLLSTIRAKEKMCVRVEKRLTTGLSE